MALMNMFELVSELLSQQTSKGGESTDMYYYMNRPIWLHFLPVPLIHEKKFITLDLNILLRNKII